MANQRLIPVIDYTSRDYASLRDDLILLIKSVLPEWDAEDGNDFGVLLVEAFSYALDTLHYYVDRIGAEAYLPTAVQRRSLYTIADMFNYRPIQAQPALVELEFTNTLDSEVIVPAGTRCQATIDGGEAGGSVSIRYFETLDDLTVPATKGLDPVRVLANAQEGRTVDDETLGISNGYAGQSFLLARTSILNRTISITTELGGSSYEWNEVDDLREANSADRVFKSVRMTDGQTRVVFGDGQYGAVPDLHSAVKARYRVGGGAGGNVPALSVNAIVEPVIYGISVTNPEAATGGVDPESPASIRNNAARAFRSRGRAVTVTDYVSILLSLTDIHRAKAVGNNGSSVTTYVVPVADRDGGGNTTLTGENRLYLTAYLAGRAMAGVTVSVFGPAWVPIYVKLTAHLFSSASQATVRSLIRAEMDRAFGFDSIDFDQRITVQSVMRALESVEGVDYIEVENLSLDPDFVVPPGESPVRTINMTESGPNAVPYWDSGTSLSLTLNGGVA